MCLPMRNFANFGLQVFGQSNHEPFSIGWHCFGQSKTPIGSKLGYAQPNFGTDQLKKFRMKLPLVLAFTILVVFCSAADIYWKAGVSGDWSTISNWQDSTGGAVLNVPLAGDVVYITGAGTYTVTYGLSSLLSYGGLVIGNASGTQTLTLSNTLVVGSSGTLEIRTNAVLQGSANIIVSGTLKMAGGILKTAATSLVTVSGVVVCTASSTIQDAAVTLTATASWTVNAATTLSLSGSAVVTFSGTNTLVMNGDISIATTAKIMVTKSCTQSGSGNMQGSGTLQILASYTVSTTVGAVSSVTCAVDNQGSFTTTGSGTVMLASTYSQSANQSSLIINSQVNCTTSAGLTVGNGTFGGSGTLSSNLALSGVLSPGNSPGTVTIFGDFTADRNSVCLFEVAGTGANQYDSLVVTGRVTILGWVNFKGVDPYSFTIGDSITHLRFSSLTYNPLANYLTGNGFALKKPKIIAGSVSMSMQVQDLFAGAASTTLMFTTIVICTLMLL
jgi:hypothetical protein